MRRDKKYAQSTLLDPLFESYLSNWYFGGGFVESWRRFGSVSIPDQKTPDQRRRRWNLEKKRVTDLWSCENRLQGWLVWANIYEMRWSVVPEWARRWRSWSLWPTNNPTFSHYCFLHLWDKRNERFNFRTWGSLRFSYLQIIFKT